MKKINYLLLIIFLYACSYEKKEPPKIENNYSGGLSYPNTSNFNQNYYNYYPNYNNQLGNNYTTSPNYKYEYKTGTPGNYEYNYDIFGSDDNGNSVYGNIDIQGKYGSGYIEDDYGNQKYIDVEWVDKGVLEGTDEDGNYYELEVDE